MNLLDRICLHRLHALAVPKEAELFSEKSSVERRERLTSAFLVELARLGCRIENADAFQNVNPAFFAESGKIFLEGIAAWKGSNVSYVPLFLDFPSDVPDEKDYFSRRVLGALSQTLQKKQGMPAQLPVWLFDLDKYGADPVSQMQDAAFFEKGKKKLKKRVTDAHTEWTSLRLLFLDERDEKLRGWLRKVLASKSSIRASFKEDAQSLIDVFGGLQLSAADVPQKETRSFLSAFHWNHDNDDELSLLVQTPTDVLRMFAALTETDVSLSGEVKFPKLSRKNRRRVLALLENCFALEEDLLRHKSLWKKIRKGMHPGEWPKRFPRCCAAFTNLSANEICSFQSTTEWLLAASKELSKPEHKMSSLSELLEHLSSRPGEFARRYHELLRVFPQQVEQILNAFDDVALKVPFKTLLVLKTYMETINEQEHRVILTKTGKMFVDVNASFAKLSEELIGEVDRRLHAVLIEQLSGRQGFDNQKIWLDPQLETQCVALQERAASDAVLPLARGSHLNLDVTKVLRLFVYWKEQEVTTDLDLSLMTLDKNFKYLGHVSYTRLSGTGIQHSGDIQSAPKGAAEFIDVELSALDKNVAFLVPQIHRYSGSAFASLTCYAGWMMRENVDANAKLFDASTVAQKFNVSGVGGYCLPFLVDVKNKELVVMDLFMGNKTLHNAVEHAFQNVERACRAIHAFTTSRPTLSRLIQLHVQARGGVLVQNREEADLTFGLQGCTFDLAAPEEVLSRWL